MSFLVSYSSGEEEERRSSKKKVEVAAKDLDVNYDDVQMEMSDDNESSDDCDVSLSKEKVKKPKSKKADEEDGSNDPEKELFATDVEYRAYKNQFTKNGDKKKGKKSSEYGAVEKLPEKRKDISEYGADDVAPVARPNNDRLKRLRQASNEDFSAVVKESEEDRNVASSFESKKKKNLNEKERSRTKEKSIDHHSSSDDRRHHRNRSRSASRETKRSKKDRRREERRRHRSRSRSRDRQSRRHRSRSTSRERSYHQHRDNKEPQRVDRDTKRQELRNRKLVALGLTEAGSSDRYHSGQVPTASAMAAAAAAVAHTFSGPDQVEAQLAHVKAVTGVDLPKYYNPTAINPLKYAEQIKKRQMLWGTKKSETSEPPAPIATAVAPTLKLSPVKKIPSALSTPQGDAAAPKPCSFNKWEATNFGDCQANEKFRRLMGIKGGAQPSDVATVSAPSAAPAVDSRKMFVEQEMEYERARAITHTQRGLGLGFSSIPAPFKPDPNATAPKPSTAGINFVKK